MLQKVIRNAQKITEFKRTYFLYPLAFSEKNSRYPFHFVETSDSEFNNKINAEMDITTFLQNPCSNTETDLSQLQKHIYIKKLFKKYNAISTSSAAAERPFSFASKNTSNRMPKMKISYIVYVNYIEF